MSTNSANNILQLPASGSADSLRVPEGEYRVVFERYSLSDRYGRGSLELWFRIVDYGPYFEREVARYYKVAREGKRSFRASFHGAYTREFVAVHGRKPDAGLAGLGAYRNIYVFAKVRVVTTDHRQRKLPEALQYSVIHCLLGRAEQ